MKLFQGHMIVEDYGGYESILKMFERQTEEEIREFLRQLLRSECEQLIHECEERKKETFFNSEKTELERIINIISNDERIKYLRERELINFN